MDNLSMGAVASMGAPRYEPVRTVQVSDETAMSAERVRQMAAKMQRQIERMNVSLAFTTYGGGDKFAVVVANKATGEVIREIPSRELQELYTKMDELSGLLFNRQV
jgi:flagellar protein FlaG